MKFCSTCGGLLERRAVVHAERARLVCTHCTRIHYENPKVLVMSLVTCGQKLLLARRATAPKAGMWAPPAGFVELGENLDAAAAREVREETGVIVDPADLELHVVSNLAPIGEIYVCFRGVTSSEEACPGLESDDCRYFTHDEVPWDRLAYPQLNSYIEGIFVESSRNQFSVHYTTADAAGLRICSYVIGKRRTRFETAEAFEPQSKGDYFDPTHDPDGGACHAATWRPK